MAKIIPNELVGDGKLNGFWIDFMCIYIIYIMNMIFPEYYVW